MAHLKHNHLTINGHTLHWLSRTYLMGILNITPDSFSGDGLLTDVDSQSKAIAQAKKFEEASFARINANVAKEQSRFEQIRLGTQLGTSLLTMQG